MLLDQHGGSVDVPQVEPGDLFVERLPAKFRDQAPKVVEDEAGNQFWQMGDGRERPGQNAFHGQLGSK